MSKNGGAVTEVMPESDVHGVASVRRLLVGQSVPRREPDEDRDIIEDTMDKTAFVRTRYPQWGDPG